MLICCDEQQSSSLQTWEAEFFMMDDIKALRAARFSRRTAERHRWGWFAIVRDSRLNRPFHPRSFSLQCAGWLVLLPSPVPPSGSSLREHQHWGIFPVPSRAAEQHVVLEQPCLSFQLLPVPGDLYVDIRPIFDPRELLPLKKDT